MAEQTDDDDGNRPLTPDERKALRRLLAKEPEIIDVATNFSHLGWFASFMLKLAKWTTGLVGAVIAWQTYTQGKWGIGGK